MKKIKCIKKYTVHSDCSLIFPYLKTGNYSFRITERDKNGNGRLDIGSILEKKERESELLKHLTANPL